MAESVAVDVFDHMLKCACPICCLNLSAYHDLVAVDVVRDNRRPGVAAPVMKGRAAMLEMTKAVFDAGLRYQ